MTDVASISAFAQSLVRIPSQAGIDSPDKIIAETLKFGAEHGITFHQILDDKKNPVALVCEIKGAHPGKTWALNATLDTAPAGDPKLWHKEAPFSGEIRNNQLYGRGAADSKIGVAIFSHLAAELSQHKNNMHGNLLLILDADEHTGTFGGIKAAMEAGYKPDGIMIGYAGDDKIVVGSRGFSRYEITMTGKSAHSGATAPACDNALVRLAGIVSELTANQPKAPEGDTFPRPPKLTVTGMEAGDGFSVVPSKATAKIDVRLTPTFNEAAADRHIRDAVLLSDLANKVPEVRRTEVRKVSSQPAFLTEETSELRIALREAIEEITGQKIPEHVSGPSNIGNFMATRNVEVIAGHGVPSKNIHAPNEMADLKSVDKVYRSYRAAIQKLLKL